MVASSLDCHRSADHRCSRHTRQTHSSSSALSHNKDTYPHSNNRFPLLPPHLSHYAPCNWHSHTTAHTARHRTGHARHKPRISRAHAQTFASRAGDRFASTADLVESLIGPRNCLSGLLLAHGTKIMIPKSTNPSTSAIVSIAPTAC